LIEGHTDATPYSSDDNYSNWDLSADRANSARRLLQRNGVRSNQVTQVRGYADQMPRVKDNPFDPSNRRVSILVKNDNESVPTLSAANVVNGTTPLSGTSKPEAPAKHAAQPQEAHSTAEASAKPETPHTVPAAATPEAKPTTSKLVAKLNFMDKLKSMMLKITLPKIVLPWAKK
jgi:chemotaxis protein MotB